MYAGFSRMIVEAGKSNVTVEVQRVFLFLV
jgi:hypothetical protein